MGQQKQRAGAHGKSSGLSVGLVVHPRQASAGYVEALKQAGARESLVRAVAGKPAAKGGIFR